MSGGGANQRQIRAAEKYAMANGPTPMPTYVYSATDQDDAIAADDQAARTRCEIRSTSSADPPSLVGLVPTSMTSAPAWRRATTGCNRVWRKGGQIDQESRSGGTEPQLA
jgi:hypothetical protein